MVHYLVQQIHFIGILRVPKESFFEAHERRGLRATRLDGPRPVHYLFPEPHQISQIFSHKIPALTRCDRSITPQSRMTYAIPPVQLRLKPVLRGNRELTIESVTEGWSKCSMRWEIRIEKRKQQVKSSPSVGKPAWRNMAASERAGKCRQAPNTDEKKKRM